MAGIPTTWNDWAEMKQRDGWRTAWVRTDELGRVEIGAIPPAGWVDDTAPAAPAPEPPAPDPPRSRPKGLPMKPDPEPPLTARLRILQANAWRAPGKPASITLNSGLRLDLVAEKSGAYRLLLARQGVAPSAKELETVCKYWPEHSMPAGLTPEPVEHETWRGLVVRW